jgi:hypothetical protein
MVEHDLDDLLAPFREQEFRRALEAAFARGKACGIAEERTAVRARILLAMGDEGPTPALQESGASFERGATSREEEAEDRARRAPKGLTREVVRLVLSDGTDGHTLQEVQQLSQMMDHRVSSKTVYNELIQHPDDYRRFEDRWFLRSAAESGSPNPQSPNPGRLDIFS